MPEITRSPRGSPSGSGATLAEKCEITVAETGVVPPASFPGARSPRDNYYAGNARRGGGEVTVRNRATFPRRQKGSNAGAEKELSTRRRERGGEGGRGRKRDRERESTILNAEAASSPSVRVACRVGVHRYRFLSAGIIRLRRIPALLAPAETHPLFVFLVSGIVGRRIVRKQHFRRSR